jgi:hypothetical protein
MAKKGEGSQVKESTDSNTTLEDEDVRGKFLNLNLQKIVALLKKDVSLIEANLERHMLRAK